MIDWLSWCFQAAPCIWWPFDSQREFMLYIELPSALIALAATARQEATS